MSGAEDFAKRLNIACDNSGKVPPINHGRQTYLAKELGVTPEAVRRYLNGTSTPRRKTMGHIAELLGVDIVWLERGIAPLMPPKEQKNFVAKSSAVTHLAFGIASLQSGGGGAAFSEGNEPWDFLCVHNAKMYRVAVSQGFKEGAVTKFRFPTNSEGLTCVGVIIDEDKPKGFKFLQVSQELVDSSEGGLEEAIVEVRHDKGRYYCGDTQVPETEGVLP